MFIKRSPLGRFQPSFGDSSSRAGNNHRLNPSQTQANTLPSSPACVLTHQSEIKASQQKIPVSTIIKNQPSQYSRSNSTKDLTGEKLSFTSSDYDDKQNQKPNNPDTDEKNNQEDHQTQFEDDFENVGSEWRFEKIEVKSNSYLCEDETSEDSQISQWDKIFCQYDMNDDQQNEVCSEEGSLKSESEEEYFFEEEKNVEAVTSVKRKVTIKKYESRLEEIEEVDEPTITRFSFMTPKKSAKCESKEE